jgi:hypothetical protein
VKPDYKDCEAAAAAVDSSEERVLKQYVDAGSAIAEQVVLVELAVDTAEAQEVDNLGCFELECEWKEVVVAVVVVDKKDTMVVGREGTAGLDAPEWV